MPKQKYQRIIIRSELIRDARKIQKAYGLANWGAAINFVFAMYRQQVLEHVNNHPDKAATTIPAVQKATIHSKSHPPTDDILPLPSKVPEPSGSSLRDFLRAKVREAL